MQVFWLQRIYSRFGSPALPSSPAAANRPGFQPSAQDILRGLVNARERDRNAGRPVRGFLPTPSELRAKIVGLDAPAVAPRAREPLAARPVFRPAAQPRFMPSASAGVSAVGPIGGAFAAALMVGTTALKSFFDVLGVMTQAASPNVWRTFTGNFEILVAKIGTSVVPAFIRLAGVAEELANKWERIPKPVRDEGANDAIASFLSMFGPAGVLGGLLFRFGGGSGPSKMDVNTAEPRFSAVESVWEQMAMGFLRENDIQRELLNINREMLQEMIEFNDKSDRQKKPGK